MKQVNITFLELTKEEASKLTKGQVLIYNPLTGLLKIEDVENKNFIARSKYAIDCLVYLQPYVVSDRSEENE